MRVQFAIALIGVLSFASQSEAGLVYYSISHKVSSGPFLKSSTSFGFLEILESTTVVSSTFERDGFGGDEKISGSGFLDSPIAAIVEAELLFDVIGGSADFSILSNSGGLSASSLFQLESTTGTIVFSNADFSAIDLFAGTLDVGSYKLTAIGKTAAASSTPGDFGFEILFPGQSGEFGGGSGAVPEPSSFVLAVLGILFVGVVKFGRSRRRGAS